MEMRKMASHRAYAVEPRLLWRLALIGAALASLLWVHPAAARPLGTESLPLNATLYATSSANSHLSYTARGRDLLRSEDGGQTWYLVATLSSRITALQPGNQDSSLLYAGTESNGFWRSYDAGVTWQQASDGMGLLPGTVLEVTTLALQPGNDKVVYAATGYWFGTSTAHFTPSKILVSRDGGTSWLPLVELAVDSRPVVAILPYANYPLFIKAVTSDGVVHSFGNEPQAAPWASQVSDRASDYGAWSSNY